MRLAAVQYRPPKGQPDQARAEIAALVGQAGEQGADLIVLPELCTTGYIWRRPEDLGPFAEEPRGPTFQLLRLLARRHGAWIVCGLPERFVTRRSAEGRHHVALFNSAIVVMPDGELATCYRKCLLYEADEAWANTGWRRAVCRSELGRVAPGICMDLNDPEFIAFLDYGKVDIVAFPTNWVDEGVVVHDYWRERLGDWRGWFVAANTWGEDEGVRFTGRSAILAPGGEVVTEAPYEGDCVLVAEVPVGQQPQSAM